LGLPDGWPRLAGQGHRRVNGKPEARYWRIHFSIGQAF